MKTILPILAAIFFPFISCYATTITWVGATGGNWSSTANWSPANVPGSSDDVVFNTSVTVSIDMIPATTPFTYLINSLAIANNASVIISRIQTGGGTRLLQVKSTSAATPGLKIDTGCVLTINAANDLGTLSFGLDLTGGAGVTGEIYGKLYFTGTGTGTGDAGLNLYTGAANYAHLAVKNTGTVKYFANSGNTASAAGAYLIMEGGSTYEINKNGGSLPFGNWDNNSNVLVTGAISPGNIYFSQAQYGNFKWDTPAMSAATQLISSFSPVTAIIVNNFTITNTNGKELRLKSGSSATIYDYTVNGNISIAAAGIVAITGNTATTAGSGARLHFMGSLNNAGILKADGVTGTINDIELNGTTNQDISNTGTLSGAPFKLIMNNAAGATLLTPLILPGTTTTTLQLNNGKIKTTASTIITMLDNANYTGGSSASFIDGPMKKTGDDDTFSFPVGTGGIYAPINFYSLGMAITDTYQAEYFRLNPQAAYGVNYQTPINHISYVEYWQLQKTVGSTAIPANITLHVNQYSFAKDIPTLYVARFNSGDLQWKNSGIAFRSTGVPSPPYVTGSITSAPLTQFGIFALSSSLPEVNNPLPLALLRFEAKKINGKNALLTWQLAEYSSGGARFEIQRSVNGKDFIGVYSIIGNETEKIFSYQDEYLIQGVTLYRLSIIQEDGQVVYSHIATITNTEGFLLASVIPNPVRNDAVINLHTPVNEKIRFSVYDGTGKMIKQWSEAVLAGDNNFKMNTDHLRPGVYILSANAGQMKQVLRFVKI